MKFKSTGMLNWFTWFSIAAVIGFAALALLGWALGWLLLASGIPKYIPMAPNTAFLFIIIGLSLSMYVTQPAARLTQGSILLAAFFSLLLSSMTLVGNIYGHRLGSGLMSPVTATCFILAAFALFFLWKNAKPAVSGLGAIIGLSGFVMLLGYLFGAPLLYGRSIVPVAFTTATAFLFLGISLCFVAGAHTWPLRLFTGASTSALLLRRIVPAMLAITLVQSWVDWLILEVRDESMVLKSALEAILTLLVVYFAVSRLARKTGRQIDDANAQREEAQKKLKASYEELKRTQDQLIQTSKMAAIGQLAGGIAHEINNPLTGILNNVQLAKMMAETNKEFKMEDFRELLDAVEESSLRCKKITQSLLDFTHYAKREFLPVSLNAIIDKVVGLIFTEMRLDNITILKGFQPDLIDIEGDPQLLQQVILGLIANAKWAIDQKTKSGAGGGNIIIKTYQDTETKSVILEISDNGIGIPEQNLPRLFEPFFTTNDVGEGTGLGLALIYNIIQNHNGKMSVDSQVNAGATFKIAFPANKKQGKLRGF